MYDLAGNMTKITHPNGRVVEFTYTGIYQPDLVKTEVTGDATIDTVADYDYQYNSTGDGDVRPLLETKTLDNCIDGASNKVALNLLYDSVLRVTSHDWTQNSSTTVGFGYQYDLAGNLTKADHLHNSAHDEEFEYDGSHRLTKYIKDPDGSPSNQNWTLDGVYNWTDFTDYGTTETRTHNSVNEVTAIDTNNDADMLYDSNGNLTKWTDDPEGTPVVKEFLWDDLNRLTKIIVDSNDEAIFIYDVNNQRVRKEYDSDDDGDIDVNDETIEFVWSDAHVLEEYVDGSIDRNYVHGNMFIDELILFDDGSNVYYYLQDFRYSVYAIVNDTGGTLKTTYRYDPYGKRTVVSNPGSLDNSYGFTGRYHDDSDDTDLIYFRNRWMSPEMGRFVSRDPEEYIDGMNLYSNYFTPFNSDPFGLETVYCPGGKWKITGWNIGGFALVYGYNEGLYKAECLYSELYGIMHYYKICCEYADCPTNLREHLMDQERWRKAVCEMQLGIEGFGVGLGFAGLLSFGVAWGIEYSFEFLNVSPSYGATISNKMGITAGIALGKSDFSGVGGIGVGYQYSVSRNIPTVWDLDCYYDIYFWPERPPKVKYPYCLDQEFEEKRYVP